MRLVEIDVGQDSDQRRDKQTDQFGVSPVALAERCSDGAHGGWHRFGSDQGRLHELVKLDVKAALDLLLGEDESCNRDEESRPDGQVGQVGATDGRQREAVRQAEEKGHRPGYGDEEDRPSPDLQGILLQ